MEAVSSRLKGELVHPNRTSALSGLQFSPDGRRLIAGDWPGGVAVVWDVASGERLTTIETGARIWGGEGYLFLSPDWQTLFVSRGERKTERLEQDGQRLFRWECRGDVRAWDVTTGQLRRTFQHEPQRDLSWMQLAPDATHFVTFDILSGVGAGGPKHAMSLWDVATGRSRPLPDRLYRLGRFSPDGRTWAVAAQGDDDEYATALKLLDTATGRERLSIPIADKQAAAYVTGFTPDGRLMVLDYRVFKQPKRYEEYQSYLKWWDAATGREVASFAGDKNSAFYLASISPDGRTLATLSNRDDPRKLHLFRIPDRQLIQAIALGAKVPGESVSAARPVFSPDGRWLAVVTQVYPERFGRNLDANDIAQPRIHLIDAASGTVRETLVSPQGFGWSACFSPDGRTLATSGRGRVLLWDVAGIGE